MPASKAMSASGTLKVEQGVVRSAHRSGLKRATSVFAFRS
jgi:hypothetical protein